MPVFSQAAQFFREHGCTTNDTNAKYHSRAAMLYKEKLAQLTAEDERKGTNVLVCVRIPDPFARYDPTTVDPTRIICL